MGDISRVFPRRYFWMVLFPVSARHGKVQSRQDRHICREDIPVGEMFIPEASFFRAVSEILNLTATLTQRKDNTDAIFRWWPAGALVNFVARLSGRCRSSEQSFVSEFVVR